MKSRSLVLAALLPVALLAAGCGDSGGTDADLVAGKQMFVKNCGSCHTLARAGTKGVVGPNLDLAFERARQDGFGQSTFQRAAVLCEIAGPVRRHTLGEVWRGVLESGARTQRRQLRAAA